MVPKLRFENYFDNWFSNKLSDLAVDNKLSNGVFNDPLNVGSGYKLINVVNMYKEPCIDENDLSLLNLDEKTFRKNQVFFGDLFFTRSSLVKEGIAWSNIYLGHSEDVTFDGHLIKLTPDLKKTNPKFLYFCLKTSSVRKQLIESGKTATMTTIGQSDVGKTLAFIPQLEEQTKIADFLSSVDERIILLNKQYGLLCHYKKGMIQKIFSQELRFKDENGEEFPEWEEKKLIESVDTTIQWGFVGGPFGSNLKSEEYTDSGIRIIQLQNIGDGEFLNNNKIYTSLEKADQLLNCNIYPNDILISKMGDPVARCCIVPDDNKRYVMCSDGIRLVVDKKNYSYIFMFYQINHQDFRQCAFDVSTGSTRRRIGLSELKQLPIKVPCLEEQTKIANFLSALDDKIAVKKAELDKLKTWKQGLLQQMFI
ncbi:restriction endonuclease subunit S [Yersinia enterocolitica]|uniref:restriction endonuclease subunit S n=1 Tax=Yersinia enterocolitica TaxID=630 RepID=UPI003CFDD81E